MEKQLSQGHAMHPVDHHQPGLFDNLVAFREVIPSPAGVDPPDDAACHAGATAGPGGNPARSFDHIDPISVRTNCPPPSMNP
jgi:hypothetical protein